MTRLDNYQSALLAAFPDVPDATLGRALDAGGAEFAPFIVGHGLGPLWHERTGRDEFRPSRLSAEAMYMAQEEALREIDEVFESASIEYVVIKGAASRLLLCQNPAIRTCHDIDLLVSPEDRVRAAATLINAGYVATLAARSISRELVLSRGAVDIDLHWALLREGRLRHDDTAAMLGRRRRSAGVWMLGAEDAFFLLLVHPAFAKHLSGWEMGLHRVADIVTWMDTQSFDWSIVFKQLENNGVTTAAWATLRWVELLMDSHASPGIAKMIDDTHPGRMRRAWLNRWLTNDLSARTADAHWARLLGFSLFLHDTPADSMRALAGRYRARRRSSADLAVFKDL